jgi:hypothetical protein
MEGSEISWERTPVEVTFTFRAEGALSWSSKNDGQKLCPDFRRCRVEERTGPKFCHLLRWAFTFQSHSVQGVPLKRANPLQPSTMLPTAVRVRRVVIPSDLIAFPINDENHAD